MKTTCRATWGRGRRKRRASEDENNTGKRKQRRRGGPGDGGGDEGLGMQKLAKELSIVIPVSFFEKANNAHYNSITIIDADGSDLGIYRMVNAMVGK
ncbi:hypothetical protein HN51_017836 [Arachis hypogaea]